MTLIDNQTADSLPHYVTRVLQTMFAKYQHVVVRRKLAGGLSGSQVYLVRPYPTSGPPELPSVVKVDYYDRIAYEWEVYRNCIRNRLPQIADIRQEPTYLPNSLHGGLWYPLVGADTFSIASLREYYLHAAWEDIQYVLETQLFPLLNQLWQYATLEPELHWGRQYDDFMPPQLYVHLQTPSPGTTIYSLHPDNVHQQLRQTGDWVQLSSFRVIKIYRGEESGLGLDNPVNLPVRYRLRVDGLADVSEFEVGGVLHQPLVGQITRTRQDVLQKAVREAVGDTLDIQQEMIPVGHEELPNPLLFLPKVLNYSATGKLACIHGDLNLENILVQTATRQANLIDFALAGQYHVIRDLIHLESALGTRLLPIALQQTGQTPHSTIANFYRQLHCAVHLSNYQVPPGLEKPFYTLLTIRRAALAYNLLSSGWEEYYRGLFLYLVGSLRFKDLIQLDSAPLPHQIAFYGAAVISDMLINPPECMESLTVLTHSKLFNQPNLPSTELVGDDGVKDETYRQFRNKLLDQLRQYFNNSELQDICFWLDVPYEDLAGGTKQDKTRALIEYLERRGKLKSLLEICIEQRPNVSWEWEEIIKRWVNESRPASSRKSDAML